MKICQYVMATVKKKFRGLAEREVNFVGRGVKYPRLEREALTGER